MRTLIFDIETAPALSHIWSLWNEVRTTDLLREDWYILCWAAKWLGEKKVFHSALPNFKGYRKHPRDDKKVMEELWNLLDSADVAIAHNGVKFDRRKVNTRFIINGLTPPSPYKMIDTLIVAKKEFNFLSNRLSDLGQFLKVGKKIDSGGFKTWEQCIDGNKQSWANLVNYCKHDVQLLERVYLKLRPYITQHPNVGVYDDAEKVLCPKCGSDDVHYRGYAYTSVSKFHQFKCNNCGGWGRERINTHPKTKMKKLATNIST